MSQLGLDNFQKQHDGSFGESGEDGRDRPPGGKVKSRPNRRRYIAALRAMTPEQRLLKAFELSEFSKRLFIEGLRARHPDLDERSFHQLVLARLEKCHNKNY